MSLFHDNCGTARCDGCHASQQNPLDAAMVKLTVAQRDSAWREGEALKERDLGEQHREVGRKLGHVVSPWVKAPGTVRRP